MHAWLLLMPYNLCYDWSAGSIPLLTDASDPRVFAVLVLYTILGLCIVLSCVFLCELTFALNVLMLLYKLIADLYN